MFSPQIMISSNNQSADNSESAEDPVAQRLWDALRTARCSCALPTTAEDAVFRFYLPLAHARAAAFCANAEQSAAAKQAAELGLAKAVLAWRGTDCPSFTPFALVAIDAHLRRLRQGGRLP